MTAEEVLACIHQEGGRAEALEADLADPSSVPRTFDAAEASLGPVDVLVNNAAHCVPDTFVPQDLLIAQSLSPGGVRKQPFSSEEHVTSR